MGASRQLCIIHRARSSLPIPPGNRRPNWIVTIGTRLPHPLICLHLHPVTQDSGFDFRVYNGGAKTEPQGPCLPVLLPPGPLRFEAVIAGFFPSFLPRRAEPSTFGRFSTTFWVACTGVSPLDSWRFLFQLSPSTPCTSMAAVGVLGPALLAPLDRHAPPSPLLNEGVFGCERETERSDADDERDEREGEMEAV